MHDMKNHVLANIVVRTQTSDTDLDNYTLSYPANVEVAALTCTNWR
jgi:hypothetical protein